jgi:hypothetical protein
MAGISFLRHPARRRPKINALDVARTLLKPQIEVALMKQSTSNRNGRSRLVPDLEPLLILALAVTLGACGGRPLPQNADAGLTGTKDGTVTQADGTPVTPPTIPPTIPPAHPTCVVAIRVDNCCTTAMPAFAHMVDTDPCLVLWPPPFPIPAQCEAKWPKKCELIDCAMSAPPSRLAEPVPGGGCKFKDECATDADCGLARDVRQCCSCTAVFPRELINSQACIHDALINMPPPPGCNAGGCPDLKCKTCAGDAPIPSCDNTSNGFNRCKSK